MSGGSGSIGSHTCLLLLQNGFRINVVDSLINSSSKSLDKVLLIFKKMAIEAKNNLTFLMLMLILKIQKKLK